MIRTGKEKQNKTKLASKSLLFTVADPTYQRANASRHEADRAVYTELTIVTPN